MMEGVKLQRIILENVALRQVLNVLKLPLAFWLPKRSSIGRKRAFILI
jgi:hypothetical protein